MQIDHNLLLAINFIAWFSPVYLWQGNLRLYILVVNSIFSASYWTYIAACDFLGIEYGVAILENYVDKSLIFSAIAALSLNTTLILFTPKKIQSEKNFINFIKNIIYKIPGKTIINPAKFIFLFLLIYCYAKAIPNINIGDRIYFLSLKENWYNYFLPILGLLSAFIVIWEYQNNKKTTNLDITALIYSFTFLIGFDGGRRPILITIISLSITTMLTYIERKNKFKYALINLFAIIIITGFLSFGRNLNVGWQIIPSLVNSNINWSQLHNYLILTISAPMPTIHVNTWMLEYIDIHGTQGYSSYLKAILNTMFPNFLLNQYLFGEPLVTQIGRELGWFGFDFGFMAEAIYSGGVLGVIFAHSFIGILISLIIKTSNKGSIFATLVMGIFLFGMLNGLRSDFMNLLKSFLYPSLLVYFLLIISRFKIK